MFVATVYAENTLHSINTATVVETLMMMMRRRRRRRRSSSSSSSSRSRTRGRSRRSRTMKVIMTDFRKTSKTKQTDAPL